MMLLASPRLCSLYKAYTFQMDYYSQNDGMKVLRQSAARDALDRYFEEVERYLDHHRWEPWTGKKDD